MKESEAKAEWEDARCAIVEGSEELGVGEIVSVEEFSLQEAMCSVELMDPKMDIGMGADGVLLLSEMRHLGRLPESAKLTESDQLYLIDRWIELETLYYQGYNLVQTLYTSYYLQDLSLLKGSATLHAYGCTMVRRCAMVKDCICRAKNYTSESFSHFSFGVELDGVAMNDGKVAGVASRQAKALRQAGGELSKALAARLEWSCALLNAHHCFEKYNGAGLADALAHLEAAERSSKAISKIEVETNLDCAFEPDIIRRISSSTSVPRILNRPDLSECMEFHAGVIRHLKEIALAPQKIRTIRHAKISILNLSHSNVPIVVRSRLLNVLCPSGHRFVDSKMEDAIAQDMAEFGIPTSYLEATYKNLQFHLSMISVCLSKYLRCLAHDKPRSRRILPHLCQNWASLLPDADILDLKAKSILHPQEPNGRYFFHWHLNHLHSINLDYICLGFDLQLYEPYEMPMIWWYLDHLNTSRSNLYNQFSKHVSTAHQNKLNSLRKKPKKPSTQPPPQKHWYSLELELRQLLTRSIFRYIAALDRACYLPQPRLKLGSPASLYRSRMGPFPQLIHSPSLNFELFQSSYLLPVHHSSELSTHYLLSNASKLFMAAQKTIKTLLDYSPLPNTSKPPPYLLEELKAIAIVTVSNGVQVRQLLSSQDPFPQPALPVHFDFHTHQHYPIITINSSTP
ncbi:N-alpha-acetyltransferase 35, NatC auxiliary subunit-like [Schistocerca gregaria]|uniref:N-alpha-acetyltransferase 35, NatC auxiliary subunit-like n=1 Tax=Schistocerca gregaria TaxID=7010 RepID=UPI00211F3578|nr:N-alpha-acetyltransferase 35, NatC auxiliary subunit-like [Schistocerca gregaria]